MRTPALLGALLLQTMLTPSARIAGQSFTHVPAGLSLGAFDGVVASVSRPVSGAETPPMASRTSRVAAAAIMAAGTVRGEATAGAVTPPITAGTGHGSCAGTTRISSGTAPPATTILTSIRTA